MMHRAAMLCVVALVVGCGGGSDVLRVSLDDVDPSGFFWTIRATCNGGHFEVEFRPGDQLSVPGLGQASGGRSPSNTGSPNASQSQTRRFADTAMSRGADLAEPTFEPTRLSCNADGSLVVEAHPVWGQNAIAGGGFRVRRGGHTIVTGAIPMEEEEYDSSLQWWQALCRPA